MSSDDLMNDDYFEGGEAGNSYNERDDGLFDDNGDDDWDNDDAGCDGTPRRRR